MGMFDYIKCDLDLSDETDFKGKNFQTKCTPRQACDNYWISEDGVLFREHYETVDQSNRAKWIEENRGQPEPVWEIEDLMGYCTKINQRWVKEDFSGVIRFYSPKVSFKFTGWIEFEAEFANGELQNIELLEEED